MAEATAAEKSGKKEFIVRAVAWAILAWAGPIAFIGWRYDLFKKVGSLQLSGWGIIGIFITFFFLHALVKYIKAGFVEWTMAKQVITGVSKILIPLGVLLAMCVAIRNNIDCFIQALGCTMICEAAAIPVNPFPEWVWKKSQGRFESAVDYIASRVNKKEGE